ncbi:winged helix-turn-helix transcriptional regulator [Candidatus Woesearchaeota archaeon]|nr:winged helix-turn-helix transcriptional regulator [Candidatus Woesearchaeota archaeon]
MKQLDDQERKIVRELIKDPRISDNQIAKNTKVPVMTVNRKRKALEESKLLNYYCYLDTSRYGLEILSARQLYIIKFKIGITKKEFIEKITNEAEIKTFFTVHELNSFVGEKDGQLIYAVVIEGGKGNEIVEIFNGKLVPMMYRLFGNDCIKETFAFRLTTQLRLLHNYMPLLNIERGKIKKTWPDDFIFVD